MKKSEYPYPVQEYLDEMRDAIKEPGFIEDLIIDLGIHPERVEELEQNLMFEVTAQALENFENKFSPNLDEAEFDLVFTKACVATVLSELQDAGTIEAIVDDGEVKYQLTKKWKK